MKIRSALSYLLIICCLFPFVSFINTGTDIKPWTLLISLIYWIFHVRRIPFLYAGLLFLVTAALFLVSIQLAMAIGDADVDRMLTIARSLANYLSLLVIPVACHYVFVREPLDIEKILFWAALIWFLAGLYQVFFGIEIFEYVVHWGDRAYDLDAMLRSSRGVVGFAPEPTFYGTVCFIFVLFNNVISYANNEYKRSGRKKMVDVMMVVAIILLAKSSMAALFLVVYYAMSLLFLLNYRQIIFLMVLVGVVLFLFADTIKDSRLFYVLSSLYSDPTSLLYVDQSINARIVNAVFPLKGSFERYFLPSIGYGDFHEYMLTQYNEYPNLLWRESTAANEKIMSGLGALFFELGFLGFVYVYFVVSLSRKFFQGNFLLAMQYSVVVLLVAISAIPIGFPAPLIMFSYMTSSIQMGKKMV